MCVTGMEAATAVARTQAWPAEEIAEFSFLLPMAQASAIERAATRHGMTVGQFMRLVLKLHLEMARDESPVQFRA